jgi:hypothetical protein
LNLCLDLGERLHRLRRLAGSQVREHDRKHHVGPVVALPAGHADVVGGVALDEAVDAEAHGFHLA